MLFETKKMKADELGKIRWLDDDYSGKFSYLKTQAKNKTLLWYNNTLLLWVFPADIITSFREVYIMTFMFQGSHLKHFFELNSIAYDLYHIAKDECKICSGIQDLREEKKKIASMLNVYQGCLNDIGDKETALSKSWYEDNCKNGLAKEVSNNAYNFLYNKVKARVDHALYTTFAAMKKRYPVRDYAGAFIPCNLRATNQFKDRTCLCYLINVYDNPYIKQYFADFGITVDQDAIALNQLLQWVWRSAIMDGKPVNLYIPSRRMRSLLINWLVA